MLPAAMLSHHAASPTHVTPKTPTCFCGAPLLCDKRPAMHRARAGAGFWDLPAEALELICGCLEGGDRLRFSRVDRACNKIACKFLPRQPPADAQLTQASNTLSFFCRCVCGFPDGTDQLHYPAEVSQSSRNRGLVRNRLPSGTAAYFLQQPEKPVHIPT